MSHSDYEMERSKVCCSRCGKKNKVGSLFCGYCGSPVSAPIEIVSVDKKPSKEDINATKNLVRISKMQGIPIIDHIIFSRDNYFSFYENDMLLED